MSLAEHMRELGYRDWQEIDEGVEGLDGGHVGHALSEQEMREVEKYIAEKHGLNLWVRMGEEA